MTQRTKCLVRHRRLKTGERCTLNLFLFSDLHAVFAKPVQGFSLLPSPAEGGDRLPKTRNIVSTTPPLVASFYNFRLCSAKERERECVSQRRVCSDPKGEGGRNRAALGSHFPLPADEMLQSLKSGHRCRLRVERVLIATPTPLQTVIAAILTISSSRQSSMMTTSRQLSSRCNSQALLHRSQLFYASCRCTSTISTICLLPLDANVQLMNSRVYPPPWTRGINKEQANTFRPDEGRQ